MNIYWLKRYDIVQRISIRSRNWDDKKNALTVFLYWYDYDFVHSCRSNIFYNNRQFWICIIYSTCLEDIHIQSIISRKKKASILFRFLCINNDRIYITYLKNSIRRKNAAYGLNQPDILHNYWSLNRCRWVKL